MPQPQESDLDPLLAFFEEQPRPPEPPELPEPAKDPPTDDLRVRVESHERQLERALIDLTTLKSDLATLVGAVEEIRKRSSRPPDKPARVVSMPPPRPARSRTLAAIVLAIVLGAAAWGLNSAMTFAQPDAPPIDSETSTIIDLPRGVEAHSPSYEAMPARASAGITPVPSSRPPAFIGTLTVDSEPAGDVFLDRKKVGRTPLRLENLRAGSHLIWIERAGHRRWTRVVGVAANRISRVSASLEPIAR